MKTTIKCFVHHQVNRHATPDSAPVFIAFPADMSDHGYALLGKAEFEFEIPEGFNPQQSEINSLEKKLDKLADEYHRGAAAIRERISNLRCIENSPAAPQ